jgi:hypothetical protein
MMKFWLVPLAVLYSAAALAQTAAPMVGDRPLVQVKPKAARPAATTGEAAPTAAAPKSSGRPQSVAFRLQACLDIDDGSKGRLDCYDAVIKPQPKGKPASPKSKSVMDCRFTKEEDERLACFNDFVERLPKLPRQ